MNRAVPAPALPASPDRKRLHGVCGHWIGAKNRHCLTTDTVRHYICGYRCSDHAPTLATAA